MPKFPSIIPDANKSFRLVLLEPGISQQSLPQVIQEFVNQHQVEFDEHELKLDYDFWSADQILRSILPDELEVPNSFETIGHIGNFN